MGIYTECCILVKVMICYMKVKSTQLVWHMASSKTQWRCSAFFLQLSTMSWKVFSLLFIMIYVIIVTILNFYLLLSLS